MSLAHAYRTATPADIQPIAELQTDSWRRTYRGIYRDDFLDGDLLGNRLAVWQERLEQPRSNQVVLLATVGDDLVSFICAFGAYNPRWGSKIDNVHVASVHQRTGVGTELMRQAAERLGTSHGDRGVFLWVAEGNHKARRFYERLGARYAETVQGEDPPGSGISRGCRCVWSDPAALAHVAGRLVAAPDRSPTADRE